MKNRFQQLTAPLYGPLLAFECGSYLANGHHHAVTRMFEHHENTLALAHIWSPTVTKGADRLLAKGWWQDFVRMTSYFASKPALMAGINSSHIHDACAQISAQGGQLEFIELCRNISHRCDLMDSINPSQVYRVVKTLLQDNGGGHSTYLIQPLQAAIANYPTLIDAFSRVPETERMVVYSSAETGRGGPLVAIANPATNQVDFFNACDGRQSIRQLLDYCFMYPESSCDRIVIFQALDELARKPAAATAATKALNSLAHWGKDEYYRSLLRRDHNKVSTILQHNAQLTAA